MAWEVVLAHVLLPAAVAIAAGFGAWRAWTLLRYARDRRLMQLVWFYGLFAASMVPMAIHIGQIAASVGDVSLSHWAAGGELHEIFAKPRDIGALLLLHHALMLASLVVAVAAFSPRRTTAAAAGLVVLTPVIPAILAIEAGLTLYLAARAAMNHRNRRTAGSMRVATGFALFFLGHITIFLLHGPDAARNPLGDLLSLAGLIILVRVLPRPRA